MIDNKVTYLYPKEENFDQKLNDFLRRRNISDVNIEKIVFDITSQIKTDGDNALITMINKFDNISCSNLDDIRIENKLLKKAFDDLPIDLKNAMKIASSRIKSFHEKQKPNGFDYEDELGVNLGLKYSPIKRVGFYAPGGKALYPSSVLMNAIPALVAGVEERVLVSPINFEKNSEILLAAAYLAEVTEFYRMGGAQAIAALALGTEKIKKVDKIVGPGNAYVAAAKKEVFGDVGIEGMTAGPSEVTIVCDKFSNPEWVASDLIGQAEHDNLAQCILISKDKKFLKKVNTELIEQLKEIPRVSVARKSLNNNGIFF